MVLVAMPHSALSYCLVDAERKQQNSINEHKRVYHKCLYRVLTVSRRSTKKSRSSLLWFSPDAMLIRPFDRLCLTQTQQVMSSHSAVVNSGVNPTNDTTTVMWYDVAGNNNKICIAPFCPEETFLLTFFLL